MKKSIRIILLVILIVCLIGYWFDRNVKFKSQDEIIEIFKSNKETFVEAAENVFGFDFYWYIKRDGTGLSHVKTSRLRNGLYLTIHDSEEYFEEYPKIQKVVEDDKNIKRIMKKLRFCVLTNSASVEDSDCVYFIKQTSISYEAGLIYCPGGNKPKNPYITKLVKIEPEWYYYKAK